MAFLIRKHFPSAPLSCLCLASCIPSLFSGCEPLLSRFSLMLRLPKIFSVEVLVAARLLLHHFVSCFLGSDSVKWSTLVVYFLALAWESAISSKSPGLFQQKMVFGNSIWALAPEMSWFLSLSHQNYESCFVCAFTCSNRHTHTHTHTLLSSSFLPPLPSIIKTLCLCPCLHF